MIADKWVRLWTYSNHVRVHVMVDDFSYIMICDRQKHKTANHFIKFIWAFLNRDEYDKYLLIMEPCSIVSQTETLQDGDVLRLVTRKQYDKIMHDKKGVSVFKEIKTNTDFTLELSDVTHVQDNISMFNFGESELEDLDSWIQTVKGLAYLLDKLPSKNLSKHVSYWWDREGCSFKVTYSKNSKQKYILSGFKVVHNHDDIYYKEPEEEKALKLHDDNINKENFNTQTLIKEQILQSKQSFEEQLNSGTSSLFKKTTALVTNSTKKQKGFNFK